MWEQGETLRTSFKDQLAKTLQLPTRAQALKDIHTLIHHNKTTNNLRIFLSVLTENRNKNYEAELQVVAMIVKLYEKGLLDPLDKIPSLQKTVFRITELIMRSFSQEKSKRQNIMVSAQNAWLELYDVSLKGQSTEMKKKLLYNSLQSIINGGGGKVSQITAQFVVDGLLQRVITNEDYQFFKQIAKRVLVLFKKTTIMHQSSLTSLQTILQFFNIINLLPLLNLLVDKILSYFDLASNTSNANMQNSTSYKIKGQACNCLAIIGEQIDQNGLQIYDKVLKVLTNSATDKVWAVQAPGRRALNIWRNKKKLWDEQFINKNQKVFDQEVPINFQQLKQNVSQYPKTQNAPWNNEQVSRIAPHNQVGHRTWTAQQELKDDKYSHNPSNQHLIKNTGMGGGNNIQSVQNYYERQKPDNTHLKKMEELRKSIYNAKNDIQFEDTIVIGDENEKRTEKFTLTKRPIAHQQPKEESDSEGDDFIAIWDDVLELAERGKYEESTQKLLIMDDDLYFLRFFLKYSSSILGEITRSTSNKVLKKMLQIKKTNFMEQMLFKLTAQSIKCNAGRMLSNSQNLQIINHLQNTGKVEKLKEISSKLSVAYENALDQ